MKIFKLMKRGEVVSQNKSNEVAYVRRGTDYVETLGSGSASGNKIATVWVATKDGRRYEIPVDPKTGRVPEEYLSPGSFRSTRVPGTERRGTFSSTSGRMPRPFTTSPQEVSPPSSSSRPDGGRV